MTLSSTYPKEIKTKQTFRYGNKSIEYFIIKSKRRKTIEIIVEKDRITVRSPFEKSIKEIEQVLNDKIKWISQKQREIQSEKPDISKPSFDNNFALPYMGKNHRLKIIYNT
jgi:predicted metal-dependent hydrolase